MKKKYIIRRIVLVLAIVIITIASFALYRTLNKNKKSYEVMNLNFESRVDKLNSFDSSPYYKFGWLQVQGTNIDLPILDSSTSDTLLDYSYGWVSGLYNTGDNREVLLGHNILNVSSEPMINDPDLMYFESLMSFVYYDFAKDNLYVQYTKDGKDELYMIYAIGFYNYESNDSRGLTDKKEIDNYIEYARGKSIYKYDIDVDSTDHLISLVTCTRMFGVNKNQQMIVDLRKVRKNEKTYKYDVTKTKLFDKLLKKEEENM